MSAAEEETVAAQRTRAAVATERLRLIYGAAAAERIAARLEEGINNPAVVDPNRLVCSHDSLEDLICAFAWLDTPWPSFAKLAHCGPRRVNVRLHAKRHRLYHADRQGKRNRALTIGNWSIASHAFTASREWKLCVQEVVRQLGAILPPNVLERILKLALVPPKQGIWPLSFRCFVFHRHLPALRKPRALSEEEAFLKGLCVWCQRGASGKMCALRCCGNCCPGGCSWHKAKE